MLKSINELENEIEEFRKNILASKKIIASFDKLPKVAENVLSEIQKEAEICNRQAESLVAALDNKEEVLLEKIEKLTAQVREDNKYFVKSIDTKLMKIPEEVQKTLMEISDKNIETFQKMCDDIGIAIDKIDNKNNKLCGELIKNEKNSHNSIIKELKGLKIEINRLNVLNTKLPEIKSNVEWVLLIGVILLALNVFMFYKVIK